MTQLIAALDAQRPGWYESGADVVENRIIDQLRALDFGWAKSLSMELGERRYRHLRGEAEDPPLPRDPADIIREDMERAAAMHSVARTTATAPLNTLEGPTASQCRHNMNFQASTWRSGHARASAKSSDRLGDADPRSGFPGASQGTTLAQQVGVSGQVSARTTR